MPTTQTTSTIDDHTAERLSARFGSVFEMFDAGEDLFAPDAFFDLNMIPCGVAWRVEPPRSGSVL